MSSEVDFEDFGAQDPLANRMACGISSNAGTPARVILHDFGGSHTLRVGQGGGDPVNQCSILSVGVGSVGSVESVESEIEAGTPRGGGGVGPVIFAR